MNELLALMGYLILAEVVAAIVSVFYVCWVYWQSDRKSLIFRMLVRSDVVKVTATIWIGGLIAYYYGRGDSVPDWARPISAVAVMALLAPPVIHALTFYRLRNRHGNHRPPPFHEDD